MLQTQPTKTASFEILRAGDRILTNVLDFEFASARPHLRLRSLRLVPNYPATVGGSSGFDRHFQHTFSSCAEQFITLHNIPEWESVRQQWC